MKLLLSVFAAMLIGFAANATTSNKNEAMVFNIDVVHHGGGCRKSSPPGQCCHIDNRTGIVHCH